MHILTEAERTNALSQLPAWHIAADGLSLSRRFSHSIYRDGFDILETVCAIANEQDHHPKITCTYTETIVTLTTHDAGGLTERDVRFAQALTNRCNLS